MFSFKRKIKVSPFSSQLTLEGYECEENKKNGKIQTLTSVLLPSSKYRLIWDLFIFAAIWYNSVMTPTRIFVIRGESTPQALIVIDIFLDFVFALDYVLHFFRPYIDKDTGRTVTNLKDIRHKYMGSLSFYLNTIACIPILKLPLSIFVSEESTLTLILYFNILRMIRVVHFPSQFEELKWYLSLKAPVNESSFRMYVILFFAQLLMCVLGTVYFGLSSTTVDRVCPLPKDLADVSQIEMWIFKDDVITRPEECSGEIVAKDCNECPNSLFFVRSVYFLMQTLFTIGYGDSVVPSRAPKEIILACVFMLFGVFGYGLILANMTSVLANLDVVSMRFRYEMDTVSRWMSFRSVPDALRKRVEMFFTYLNRTQYGMLDDALFHDLPPSLFNELSLSNKSLLIKIPFFNEEFRSKKILDHFVKKLDRRIYPPGSHILYAGEKQREMIIIKHGKADVYVPGNRKPVSSLVPGDYIGDYQLIFGTANQLDVRVSTFSEVLVLSFHDFEEIMDHPDYKDFDFRSMGGNFRLSMDQGALMTIQSTRMFLEKIVSSSYEPPSQKLQNMFQSQDETIKGWRILPTSIVHVYWDIFALGATMYYSIICPIRIARYSHLNSLKTGFDNLFFVDYTLDLIFIVDIFLRMGVYAYETFDSGNSEVVTDRQIIRREYMRSPWFRIDVLTSIPYELFSVIFGYYSMSRIPKVLRVCQLPSIVTRLRHHLDVCMDVTMSITQVSGSLMLLFTIQMIVWVSAGWNALRSNEKAYESVYWTLTTFTTVGYGDFSPTDFRETLYATVIGAVGAVFSASIIANVTSFFHKSDSSDDNLEHKVNCIKCFMERHTFPFEQEKRIIDYFDYLDRDQEGLNERTLLKKSLPAYMSSQFLIHINQSMVTKSEYFNGCESGFLRQIMTSLEQRFFGSRSMILTSSIPSHGMYFIKKGVVELGNLNSNGDWKVLKTLETDGSFSEECLLEHWDKNPYLATAVTDSELWFLSRSKFNRLVDDFPHIRMKLKKNAKKKMLGPRRDSIHNISRAVEKVRFRRISYIHPDSYFIQCWFGIVLIVTIYSVIAIPFRLAFMENYNISATWLILDYTGDILLFVDLIIRSVFLSYFEDSHLITARKKIWMHYLQSGKLKWHVLSILPLEIVVLFVPTMCPLWTLQVWSLFRMNKMLRISEATYLVHRVESSLVKIGVKVPKNTVKLGKLFIIILLTAHIVSCIFYLIAYFNQNEFDFDTRANWANDEGLMDDSPSCPGPEVGFNVMMTRYIASLYWSMATLTTVGYGDITANSDSIIEISFAIAILVIGNGIYTQVIAMLESIVSQLDVTSSLYKTKTDRVDLYVQQQGLPDQLKVKINAYYENLWNLHKGVNGKQILGIFPESFRVEVCLKMLSPLLHKTFFIKDCTADFVADILESINLEIYLPDDMLFYDGEICDSLFFLCQGEVDLLTSRDVKFKTVSNCVLGEASFFGFEPHICTAKSVTQSEIYRLDKEDFVRCLHDNQLLTKFCDYLKSYQTELSTSKASVAKMVKNLKSTKMGKMIVTEQESSHPPGVILPDSLLKQLWDLCALVFTFILGITVPFQLSFSNSGISFSQFGLDLCLDIFFLIDVYARLYRFAIMKDGFVVTEVKEFHAFYIRDEFTRDLLSIIPASSIAFCFGERGNLYGILRLFQLLRVQRCGKYLNDFVTMVESRTKFVISGGLLRIIQIFFLVILLCHWFACAFHLIGHSRIHEMNWLVVDDSLSDPPLFRYLRSFYWALYTITTVGYGSVPVVSNIERIFAMVAMAAGAIICDAGITAILASIISMKDEQAGTNNRRIQCCKRFMNTNGVDSNLQGRVLDFYNYMDTDLENIIEEEILQDLSSSLKNEILSLFCFESLRKTSLLSDMSDGAIYSLISLMRPYLAVPGESISKIGDESEFLYVLQRGVIHSTDSSGYEEKLPIGSVIGNLFNEAVVGKNGFPTKKLLIEVSSLNGIKIKSGHPYIVFRVGDKSCRTSVKKSKNWRDLITIKLNSDVEPILHLSVKVWQKGRVHTELGCATISFSGARGEKQNIIIQDISGKTIGATTISLSYSELNQNELLSTHEVTTIAHSYCHLYSFSIYNYYKIRNFLLLAEKDRIYDRLTQQFKESYEHETITDQERIKRNWRRPSRPSTDISSLRLSSSNSTSMSENTIKLDKKNQMSDRGLMKKMEVSNEGTNRDGSFQKISDRNLKQSGVIFSVEEQSRENSSSVDENSLETGDQNLTDNAEPRWSGSNIVKTATLIQDNDSSNCLEDPKKIRSDEDNLSDKDKDWDTLIPLNNNELSVSENRASTRRMSFYVEWAMSD